MALRAEYTLHHSDLRNILSETIWKEQNGSVLSVISAFARLDMDPWQEAARLAAMPREAAVAALADVLGLLPSADPEHTDHIALARQLIEVLPDRHALGPAAQQGPTPGHGWQARRKRDPSARNRGCARLSPGDWAAVLAGASDNDKPEPNDGDRQEVLRPWGR